MSFNTDPVMLTAKKAHRCTWCAQAIEPGQKYRRWVTFDDSAFTSKMHPVCVSACDAECREYSDEEYIAYENERPAAKVQP